MSYKKSALVLNALRHLNEEMDPEKIEQIKKAWKEIDPIIVDGLDDAQEMIIEFNKEWYGQNSEELADISKTLDKEHGDMIHRIGKHDPKSFSELMEPIDEVIWYYLDQILEPLTDTRDAAFIKKFIVPVENMVKKAFEVLNKYGIDAKVSDIRFNEWLLDNTIKDYVAGLE